MCLYPQLIENRKYRANNKNGGIIPPISDNRVRYVPIGCGNCKECRKKEARKWQVRLLEDIKKHTNGKFITLTFSNESIKHLNTLTISKLNKKEKTLEEIPIEQLKGYDKDNGIATKAIRLFLERHRKAYKKPLRHWLITELGHKGTENIHLHGIIWTDLQLTEIEKIWKYGFTWKGKKIRGIIQNYVNERTVNYTIKYISKLDLVHKTYKPIILCSPGIGNNYINTYNAKSNKFNDTETNETYRTRTGHTINLPIYYRNKIYTEEEREKLWLQKLNKEERWINGQQIDISKGYKEYDNILQFERIKNKQLGYGQNKDKKYWNRKHYEEQRREIAINTRIKNAFGEKLIKRDTD